MTDNEIIKALECCRQNEGDCPDHCPLRYDTECTSHLASKALTIINRQKAEIERLTINMNAFGLGMKREKERADNARAEAVKEFAERLKEDISWHRTEMYMNGLKGTPRTHEITYECVEEYIDNLVKEFTEGDKDGGQKNVHQENNR